MIAQAGLGFLQPVLAHLPRLVPADALPDADAPAAEDGPFLHPAMRPDPDQGAAIVAVIDHAIPYAHPLLFGPEGHSRVAAAWLMEAPATETRPDIPFGVELRGPQIDALCCTDDPDAPYRRIGLMRPGRCMAMAAAASHGAAVIALAAGQDPRSAAARRHPVLAVSLPRAALAETSGSVAALFLQAAILFVLARARSLAQVIARGRSVPGQVPMVVNLSLGITAGGDDGSGPLPRLLDRIASAFHDGTGPLGPVRFVLPTGNHRHDRLRGSLHPDTSIGWHIPPADPTANAAEIWTRPGQGPDAAPVGPPRVTVTTPAGARLAVPLRAEGAGWIRDRAGRPLLRCVLQRREGGRFCMTLIVPPTEAIRPHAGQAQVVTRWNAPPQDGSTADGAQRAAPAAPDPVLRCAAGLPGRWTIALDDDSPGPCDIALHRDDRPAGLRGQGRQSRLVLPGHAARRDDGRWPGPDGDPTTGRAVILRNGTANTYGSGVHQLRVGASLARPGADVAAYCGLLADGRPGDMTAPADRSASRPGMILPGRSERMRQRLSGTSLAAPQVTRWLAAALAAGHCPSASEAFPLPAFEAGDASQHGPPDLTPPDLGLPDLPWRHGL